MEEESNGDDRYLIIPSFNKGKWDGCVKRPCGIGMWTLVSGEALAQDGCSFQARPLSAGVLWELQSPLRCLWGRHILDPDKMVSSKGMSFGFQSTMSSLATGIYADVLTE